MHSSQEHKPLPDNDTLLHVKMRESKSVEEIKKFVQSIEAKDIADMAKTFNDRGEQPLAMTYSIPVFYYEYTALEDLLLPLSLPTSYLPLASPIDSKPLLERYQHLKGTQTYTNIELGIDAVNATRKVIRKATTHPECNQLSLATQDKMKQQQYYDAHTYENSKKPAEKKALLKHAADYFTTKEIVNCGHMAFVILQHLHSLESNVVASIWHIPNGDHGFVIINANNEHAVCCDALLGDVYPIDELPTKLNIFNRFTQRDSSYILLSKFNPRYHYLEMHFSIDSDPPLHEKISRYTIKNLSSIGRFSENTNNSFMDSYIRLSDAVDCIGTFPLDSLLSHKANPNVKTRFGGSVLLRAAASFYDLTNNIKVLLEANANPNLANNKGETPLIKAASRHNTSHLKILLEHKANPNHCTRDGTTVVFYSDKDSLGTLIEHKADINQQKIGGITPLIHFVQQNNTLMIQQLLNAKADANITTDSHQTALNIAAKNNDYQVVKSLLEHHANPMGLFLPRYMNSLAGINNVVSLLKDSFLSK